MTDDSQSDSSTSLATGFGVDPLLVRYGSIFLLIVGTFGNVLSFIIFSHGTLRKSSTFRYLALVSLMDLLVLYSGLLDLFLTVEYGGAFSLRNLHPITCRLHTFITYWSQHCSSWILSFISVDRAIATNCIQFARKFCTPRSADYIVACILVVIALLNCHELAYLHVQDSDPIELTRNTDDQTTQSPVRLSLSTQVPLIAKDFESSVGRPKRNFEASFLLVSICDNPSWNFLCPRDKRDLSSPSSVSNRFFYPPFVTLIPNVTAQISSLDVATTTTLSRRQCAATKGSRYEFFWDYVWEWIDVCLYALIPFTVMSIGTFLIVYRVYYQQRRFNHGGRSTQHNQSGGTTNKAKSLFYLLFTLNLLYFILVSPVVFVTTMLFRDSSEEVAYPRFKAIIYLMQYSNHSLNFIFYGITSPPYRRTLCEWFELLLPRLPQCFQRQIRRRSKANSQPTINRFQSSTPQPTRVSVKVDQGNVSKAVTELQTMTDSTKKTVPKEHISLLPK